LVENQDLEVDEGFQRKLLVSPGIKTPVEDDSVITIPLLSVVIVWSGVKCNDPDAD